MPKVSKVSKPPVAVTKVVSSPTESSKHPWYWIKNSAGNPSATVTFAFVSFWVTTIMYLLSSIGRVGDVEFREFDTAAVGAYLIPILTLYFGRRWTESQAESKKVAGGEEDGTSEGK